MVGTIDALLDRERVLEHRDALPELLFRYQRAAEHRQGIRGLVVLATIEALHEPEPLAVVALGVGILAPLEFRGAEVDQHPRDEGMALAVELAVHGEAAQVDR